MVGTRAQSCDRYGSGTLHPGQVLGGSLPLLSPAIYIYVLINYSAVAGESVCMMIHYRVHNSRPFDPILSHISSVHALTSCFFNIPFNSIISYTLISSNWSLSFSFPHQNPACVSLLPHTCHTHCPSHPPLCVHPHTIR